MILETGCRYTDIELGETLGKADMESRLQKHWASWVRFPANFWDPLTHELSPRRAWILC